MKQFKFFKENIDDSDIVELLRSDRRPRPMVEGWNAHRFNIPPGQCPYDIGTMERTLWMTGWNSRESEEPVPIEDEIRDVAVICTSLMDFTLWKHGLFAERWLEGDLNHSFVRNNNRYIAAMSIDSIRNRLFDDVIYTQGASRRMDTTWTLGIQRRGNETI